MNVMITGTGSGIGRALMNVFLEKGHNVYSISRSGHVITEEHTLSRKNHAHLVFDWNDYGGLIRQLRDLNANLKIDILINNAGTLQVSPLTEVSEAGILEHYKINALYPLLLSRALLMNGMLGSGSHIVNIGSMGGYQGASKYPGLGAYSMSKGALSILTEVMATEWSDKNIAVNCLCLGAVQTEMLKAAFPQVTAPITPMQIASLIYEFALKSGGIVNGKILPLAASNP